MFETPRFSKSRTQPFDGSCWSAESPTSKTREQAFKAAMGALSVWTGQSSRTTVIIVAISRKKKDTMEVRYEIGRKVLQQLASSLLHYVYDNCTCYFLLTIFTQRFHFLKNSKSTISCTARREHSQKQKRQKRICIPRYVCPFWDLNEFPHERPNQKERQYSYEVCCLLGNEKQIQTVK
jgi:hypothetical protein